MAGRPRKRHNDSAIVEADKSAIIEDVSDVDDNETKVKFLKRVAKEEKANKEIFKKSERYIEIVGHKVLEKFRNATGSMYSRYWFNAKRYASEVERIKKQGGHTFEENGKDVFVPLGYINGRPFTKKG